MVAATRPVLVLLALAGTAPMLLASGAATAFSPADETGSWKVGYRHIDPVDPAREDRPVPMDIWYPVDDEDWVGPIYLYDLFLGIGPASPLAKENVDVSDVPGRTLIVFSHGFGGIAIQSTPLMEHLASHGFVVVAPTHTGNTQGDLSSPTPTLDRSPDVTFTIDTLATKATTPGDPFFGRLRTDQVGVAGHSFGGLTAMMMASGFDVYPPDTRVKAIMAIAPATAPLSDSEIESISIPTLFMTGTLDPLLQDTIDSYGLMLGVGAVDLFRADVMGANHYHFANVCQIGEFLLSLGITIDQWPGVGAGQLVPIYEETCVPPALDQSIPTRIQSTYAAAFFRHFLRSDPGYWPYLTQSWAQEFEHRVSYFGDIPIPIPALPSAGWALALAAGLALTGARVLRGRF